MKSFCILLLLMQYYFCATKTPDTDYEIYLRAKSASSTCQIKGHSRLIFLGGGDSNVSLLLRRKSSCNDNIFNEYIAEGVNE